MDIGMCEQKIAPAAMILQFNKKKQLFTAAIASYVMTILIPYKMSIKNKEPYN